MINATRLAAELKRRYRTPSDAVRALLGKDASAVLNSASAENDQGAFRAKLEQVLSECASLRDSDMAKILALLDQEMPFDRRGRDEEEEREHADPDEVKLRRFLAEKGLDPQAIDVACQLRKAAIRRDADGLPENAARGHFRPAEQAMDDFNQMFPDAARIKVDLSASELASFNRFFPDAKRIRQGTSAAREPTSSESFERMFPDAARIGVGPR
jgi:hypothetical protein